MTQRYLGLDYLRALLIARVVAMHSVLAYTDFGGPMPAGLVPIIDPQRTTGFAYFVLLNDTYGMALMFFISGLFVGPGLARRGALGFALARARRLGIPFVAAACLVMPVALYAVALAYGLHPDVVEFVQILFSGRGWSSGPLWFIWVLLLFDLCAAALHRVAPGALERLGRFAAGVARKPLRFYLAFLGCSALAYLPAMLAFGPGGWATWGPFGVQPSRVLHYAFYFFVGAGVGVYGLARGPLSEGSLLVRNWLRWIVAAAALHLFFATALFPLLGVLARASLLLAGLAYGLAFVATSAATAFALLAVFQRFLTRRIRPADSLTANSYGIYLVHYAFVMWSQYLLLSASLPPSLKAAVVFAVALGLSWLGSAWVSGVSAALKPRPAALRGLAPQPIPDPREEGERSHG